MTPAVKNAVFALDLEQTRRHLHRALVSVKKTSAQPEEDVQVPPLCPDCREPMKLVKTIAQVSGLPELFVFYCSRCKQAETKVRERAVA